MLCRYEGSCLLEAVDSLQLPVRDASKPLLLPICDVIKSHSLGQVAACGKIETGAIKNGSRVHTLLQLSIIFKSSSFFSTNSFRHFV